MNLLALDTSTAIASVALQIGKELLFAEQSNPMTHAEFILPMIEKVMSEANVRFNQLDAIIFGRGPGSFTGLRIACSIAKGLAYAHDLDLIPVSSLTTIAWSARQHNTYGSLPVLAVIDARMHEMYWANFDENQWITEEYVNPVQKITISCQKEIILAGVGVDLYWQDFTSAVKEKIKDKLIIYPSATAMIQLAQSMNYKPISVDDAEPIYIRNRIT